MTISTISSLSTKMTKYKMNQSEAFPFLTNCEFFLLEVAEKTLTKKLGQCVYFQFSIKKMKIKMKVNSKIDVSV